MLVDPTDGLSDWAVSDSFTMLIFLVIVSIFLVEYSNSPCVLVVKSMDDEVDEVGEDNPSEPITVFDVIDINGYKPDN